MAQKKIGSKFLNRPPKQDLKKKTFFGNTKIKNRPKAGKKKI